MGHFVINLNENANVGTNWVVCFVKDSNATCFNSFRLEHIPNEIEGFKVDQNVKVNIFGVEVYYSIMHGYFCI